MNLLCWIFGHKPVERRTETSFVAFNTGKCHETINTWQECARCGQRLTQGDIHLKDEKQMEGLGL